MDKCFMAYLTKKIAFLKENERAPNINNMDESNKMWSEISQLQNILFCLITFIQSFKKCETTYGDRSRDGGYPVLKEDYKRKGDKGTA